jgi:SRSO17 transposase
MPLVEKLPKPKAAPRTLDAATAARLESYAQRFREVFRRADQFQRFGIYLRGLLEAGRKNLEGIAGAATAVTETDANLAQSLQHFVSHSGWDHRKLAARLRELTRPLRDLDDSVWVVHDGAFPKKGRHSVGVHRQFARSVGKKINCQVGVFLTQLGPGGFFPLSARLYVPSPWFRDPESRSLETIPEADRRPLTKAQIALSLIDELRDSGERPLPLVAESGYLADEFVTELANRGMLLEQVSDEALVESRTGFERLRSDFGLDHFEGRTWCGWHHHVQLVFTAFQFATSDDDSSSP